MPRQILHRPRNIPPLAAASLMLASLALALSAGYLCAQDQEASGSEAPAPDGTAASSYNIALPADLVRSIVEVRTGFLDGLAAETSAFLDAEVAGEPGRIRASVDTIGEGVAAAIEGVGMVDATFGIPGLSRLPILGGTARDTLFGYVVWHEEVGGESRARVRELEAGVDRFTAAGAGARAGAADLAAAVDRAQAALAAGDYLGLMEPAHGIAGAPLQGVAAELEAAVAELEELVTGCRSDGASPLDTAWEGVLVQAHGASDLAVSLRDLVPALGASARVLEELAHALGQVAATTAAFSDSVDAASGDHYVTDGVFVEDRNVVRALRRQAVEDPEVIFPAETGIRIQNLLGALVVADHMLAVWAVEWTSARVSAASDALERHYRETVEYREDAPEEEREEALRQVDVAMKRNTDLAAALVSVRSAEVVLEDGRTLEERGAGYEEKAIVQYRNAWLHSLSAGGSLEKAVARVTGG